MIGPVYIGHANRPGWWVHAKVRANGNQSCVGPFQTATAAGVYADEYFEFDLWEVKIVLRNGKRR